MAARARTSVVLMLLGGGAMLAVGLGLVVYGIVGLDGRVPLLASAASVAAGAVVLLGACLARHPQRGPWLVSIGLFPVAMGFVEMAQHLSGPGAGACDLAAGLSAMASGGAAVMDWRRRSESPRL